MVSNMKLEQAIPNPELGSLERLATYKTKSRSYLLAVQVSLVGMEYTVYLVTFAILFMLRVWPELESGGAAGLQIWTMKIPVINEYLIFVVSFLCLYLIIMYQKQLYSLDQERNLSDEIVMIAKALAISFLITIGLTFLLKNTMIYSRVMMLMFVGITFVQASLFRYLRKWTFFQLKKTGRLKKNLLIVGRGRIGRQLYRKITDTKAHNYQFVGFVDDSRGNEHVIGTIDELERVVHELEVDIVYITIPSEKSKIDQILRRIYKYHLDIRIIPEMYDRLSSVYEYRQDYDYPCLQVVKTPLRGLNLIMKRCMDVLLTVIAVIVLLPVFMIIAIGIKLSSKGKVLFKQKRLGKNGVPFVMYKFRSMVIDADTQKNDLMEVNEMSGFAFKMKNDPRITKLGSFLRKYSLDELPQLFNVIRGEMSLIGPRPPLPDEVERYSDHHWRRMDVRPGLTGLWQVSGRSDLTFEEWINLDIQYIERWSLALEFKILLKTVPVVLKGNGAY